MYENILIGVIFLAFFSVLINVMFINDLKRGIFTRINGKRGKGLVGIVGADYKVNYYWRNFREETATIGNKVYCIHPKYVIRALGVPTIFFYYSNSEPIDMLKRKSIKPISPQIITTMMAKAKTGAQAISTKGFGNYDIDFYLKAGACAGAWVSVFIAYTIMTNLGI